MLGADAVRQKGDDNTTRGRCGRETLSSQTALQRKPRELAGKRGSLDELLISGSKIKRQANKAALSAASYGSTRSIIRSTPGENGPCSYRCLSQSVGRKKSLKEKGRQGDELCGTIRVRIRLGQ